MDNTLEHLKLIFSEILLCDKNSINLKRSFKDMGIDSILAIQTVNLIKKHFQNSLTVTDFYNLNNLENLSEFILKDQYSTYHLETENNPENSVNEDKIAIVGMSGHFPGASTITEFWQNQLNGIHSFKQTQRFSTENYFGGFLDDIESFDSEFFNISPKEALLMDPQQRLLLQTSYQALTDAGYTLSSLSSKNVGVFITALPGDYKDVITSNTDTYHNFSFTGNASAVLSGRLSYFYNMKGPCMTVDTACSSSLTLIHLAYLYLTTNQCEAALIGAASIFSTPQLFKLAHGSQLLAKNNKSCPFDEEASGFIPSEGVSCLVLKKVSQAIKDQDHIYAVIDGITLNHDGFSNGLMSPNSFSQQHLLKNTYKKFNIQLDKIGYIETHGTSTEIGDPIEATALENTFIDEENIFIGSCKANIGHTLVCSGIASIIKVVHILNEKIIPKQTNFNTLNKHIKSNKIKINTQTLQWPNGKTHAAINAFGFAGSNAHLVLSAYPQEKERIEPNQIFLPFVFSVHNEELFIQYLTQFTDYLSQTKDINLEDLSYTLYKKRTLFQNRFIVIASTKYQIIHELKNFVAMFKDNSYSQIKTEAPYVIDKITEYQKKEIPNCLYYKSDLKLQIDENYNNSQHIGYLPVYPFIKKSYWYTQDENTTVSPPPSQNTFSLSDELTSIFKKKLTEILGYNLESIDIHKTFNHYGIDSLVALQLLQPFMKDFPNLTVSTLFENNTIDKFTNFLSNSINKNTEQNLNKTTWPQDFQFIKQEQKIITTNDITIEWNFFGDKSNRPLILLPGLNALAHSYIQQIRYFYKKKYYICIPHYPGHGNSPFIKQSLDKLAIALMDNLFSIVKFDKIDFIGWSLGGCLTQLLALQKHPYIRTITLVNSAAKFEHELYAKSAALREEIFSEKNYLNNLFETNEKQLVQLISANCDLNILKHYYDELERFDTSQKLTTISTPSFVCYGAKDSIITSDESKLFQKIPNSNLVEFEYDGHFVPLTAPFLFNQLLERFITAL